MLPFSIKPRSVSGHRAIAMLLSLSFACTAGAQQPTGQQEPSLSWEDFAEDFFGKEPEEEADEARRNGFLERLEELHAAPLNINTASREELLGLPFIDEAQADSILAYRKRKRQLLSLGELMFVRNIGTETRRRLSLFAFAGDTVPAAIPVARRLLGGRHEATSRLDIPLYRRAGNRHIPADEQAAHPNRTYLGDGTGNTLRYRYHWRQEIAYGLTLQKDAGEPFGKSGNYPYDYVSFHLHFRPRSGRFAFWAGDYDVRTGQGLLLGSDFFSGRTQILETMPHNRTAIRAHTSTDEADFMRGAAGQVFAGRWKFTGFVSYRRVDGKVEDGKVVSLKTDGLHRTRTELERRRTVGNTVGGGHISLAGNGWSVGAGGYFAGYSKEIQPAMQAYSRYYLRGRSAAGIAADWAWRTERWNIAGEAAIDKAGHAATSATLRYISAGNAVLTLQHRHFSPHFVAPFAGTLQEAGRVQNERAILAGGLFRLAHGMEIRTYVDCFRHPRPTFRASTPSQGFAAFLQMRYAPEGKHRYYQLRYRTKYKQRDIAGHAGTLEYAGTHGLQGAMNFGTKRFYAHMAADLAVATRQTRRNSSGWMVSARGRYTRSGKLSAALFTALFFTDDYDTRLFAYEPQLEYAGGFPTYAYHGGRAVAQVEWEAFPCCTIGFRYGGTYYFNRQSIGSGTQRIDSSSRNDLSVQLSLRSPYRKGH